MSDIEPTRAIQRLTGRYTRPLGAHPRFRPARRSLEDDADEGGSGHRPPEDTVTLSAAARALVANPGGRPPGFPRTVGGMADDRPPMPPPSAERGFAPPPEPDLDAIAAADMDRQAGFNESWLAEQEVSALRWVASPSVPLPALIGAVDGALGRDVPIAWTAVDGFDAVDVNELLSVLVLYPRAPLLLVSTEATAPVDLGEAERAILWSAFDPPPIPEVWRDYADTCWLAAIVDVDEADAAGISVDRSIAAIQAVAPGAERLLVSLKTGRGMDRLSEWTALPRYG